MSKMSKAKPKKRATRTAVIDGVTIKLQPVHGKGHFPVSLLRKVVKAAVAESGKTSTAA